MSAHYFDLGIFNGKGDFSIWQQKMKGILVQQKVSKAIDNSFSATLTAEEKENLDELAYTSIILHLSDAVLRKVGKLKTTKELWEKLEEFYVSRSTPNKLFLLESFFSFKIDSSKDLDDNLDVFNKLVQDITNCGEKVSEEYKAIILLNVIPDTYRDVKNAIKYGRDTLTPEIVINSLRSKDMEMRAERVERKNGEVHMMRGRSQSMTRDNQSGYAFGGKKKNRSLSRPKGKPKGRKCYGCGKTGHFIKDCYAEKNKLKEKVLDETNVVTSSDEHCEVYVLLNPEPTEVNLTMKSHVHEWILDSGASIHVSSHKTWFENLQESESGHAILCNNDAYKIVGIGDITLKFDTGYVLKLHGVIYNPEMARDLISVGALETDGFSGKIGNSMLKMIKGSLVTFKRY